jgi:hypothetical protein
MTMFEPKHCPLFELSDGPDRRETRAELTPQAREW